MALDRHAVLVLSLVPGIGRETVLSLAEVAQRDGFCPCDAGLLYEWLDSLRVSSKVRRLPFVDIDVVDRAWDTAQETEDFCSERSIGIVTVADRQYPDIFRTTINEKGLRSVPSVLYYRGNLSLCGIPSVAVIGTRHPSALAIRATERVVDLISPTGCNIVSGLALGVDSIAHESAMECGLCTTAIMANGLDSIYPRQNSALAERILSFGGLLVSEYGPGAKAEPYRLVERDRLQASMSQATIVMETRPKGGSFHASRVCLLLRRPLFIYGYGETTSFNMGNEELLSLGGIEINEKNAGQKVADVLAGK